MDLEIQNRFWDSRNPTEESMQSYYEMLEQWAAETVEVGFSGKLFEDYDMLKEPTERMKSAMQLIGDWLSLELIKDKVHLRLVR